MNAHYLKEKLCRQEPMEEAKELEHRVCPPIRYSDRVIIATPVA